MENVTLNIKIKESLVNKGDFMAEGYVGGQAVLNGVMMRGKKR